MPTPAKGVALVFLGMALYVFGIAWLDTQQRSGKWRKQMAELGMIIWLIFTTIVVSVGFYMMVSVFS